MRLKDKVALMTASGAGIGRATALLFAREGAKVVVNSISERGRKTVEMIEKGGGQALFFQADVSDAAKVEKMVDFTVANFGRLDIIFNNAYYMDVKGSFRPLAEVPVETWDRAIAVGLRSYFLGCKFAIPAMLKNGGGVIINISSVAGVQGFHWFCHYNALKAGIINLTRNVTLDYARYGIRSVCIVPGTIVTKAMTDNFPDPEHPFRKLRTSMIPMGRLGEPEEIARVAVFLASDDASYINGAAITVDGGMSTGRYIQNWPEIFTAVTSK